jgi:hypothetical protein
VPALHRKAAAGVDLDQPAQAAGAPHVGAIELLRRAGAPQPSTGLRRFPARCTEFHTDPHDRPLERRDSIMQADRPPHRFAVCRKEPAEPRTPEIPKPATRAGRWASRWRVIRTSNAYVFRDPQQRLEGVPASKSENPLGTQNQEVIDSSLASTGDQTVHWSAPCSSSEAPSKEDCS